MGLLKAEWMLPEGKRLKLPNGGEVPSVHWDLDAEAFTPEKAPAYQPFWFKAVKESTPKMMASLSPSMMEPCPKAQVKESISLGRELKITGLSVEEKLGTVLHALIAAEAINPTESDDTRTANRLIQSWGLDNILTDREAASYIR
jgi:hypothetical protein